MANEALDTFLKGASEPAPVADTPSPEPAAQEPEPRAPEPAPKPENDDDEPLPVAAEGEPVVPRRALEDERHKRQDWKEKATRAEVERDMLAKQIEELKKAPQIPPVQREPLALIDPAQDPQGFFARIQSVMLNERLNTSELLLRKELGADKVDAAIAEFKQAAEADQTLYVKLYAQHDPYGWMAKEVARMRLQRDIGDDPEAYEAKLKARWEADAAKPQAPLVSPVANLPPSLANVRSAAARGAPAFSGPPALSDIFGPAGVKR